MTYVVCMNKVYECLKQQNNIQQVEMKKGKKKKEKRRIQKSQDAAMRSRKKIRNVAGTCIYACEYVYEYGRYSMCVQYIQVCVCEERL